MATAVEAQAIGTGHGEKSAVDPGPQSTAPGAPTAAAPQPYIDSSNGESSSGASAQAQQQQRWDYGGNPLAREYSHLSQMHGPSAAFFQPGMFKEVDPNKANAWALSSYGGWWIGLGIIFIPGSFEVAEAYGGETPEFFTCLGFYIYGWFIFTVLVWLATLRSTAVFSALLLSVWLAFLCLATSYIDNTGGDAPEPHYHLQVAGGVFGIIAAFLAWCFFDVPTFPFPWSPEGREKRGKVKDEEKNA
ncbi:MAG: hypothetical protein Q9162_005266 [Coniocarpon cinnabarinum]